jgi:hypothetical protein
VASRLLFNYSISSEALLSEDHSSETVGFFQQHKGNDCFLKVSKYTREDMTKVYDMTPTSLFLLLDEVMRLKADTRVLSLLSCLGGYTDKAATQTFVVTTSLNPLRFARTEVSKDSSTISLLVLVTGVPYLNKFALNSRKMQTCVVQIFSCSYAVDTRIHAVCKTCCLKWTD